MKISKEFAKAFFNSPVVVFAVFLFNLVVFSAIGIIANFDYLLAISVANFLALVFMYTASSVIASKLYKFTMPNPLKKLLGDFFTGDQYILTIGFSNATHEDEAKTYSFMKDAGLRIRLTLRDHDTCYRDGELYVAVIRGIRAPDQIRYICRRLAKILDKPYTIDGEIITVKAHIGAAKIENRNRGRVVKCSEDLMFRARIKNNDFMLDDQLSIPTSRKTIRMINSSIVSAIEQGQLKLLFHTKLDFKTKKLVGVEALLRWDHPELGILTPKQFLNYIDKDLQQHVTKFVISAATDAKVSMNYHGINVPVSINLFASDLLNQEAAASLVEAMEQRGLKPGSIIVEIKELSILEDKEEVAKVLVRFDEMGVKIALDDFHIPQLTYIFDTKIPISEIKLDKNMVLDEIAKPGGWGALKNVVEISHNYGARIVIEKIDDEQAFNLLDDLGLDTAQGFLFSKPIQLSALIDEFKLPIS